MQLVYQALENYRDDLIAAGGLVLVAGVIVWGSMRAFQKLGMDIGREVGGRR